MKELILIRHAKSDWSVPSKNDFSRPLNGRGEKAAPLMGKRLAARGCNPQRLISSPAKRARQTAKKIARELDYPERQIEYLDEIYDADLNTLIELVRHLKDHYQRVILIGHNPGFSELGQWLTPDTPEWLPTCGLLELELPIKHWTDTDEGCATLTLYDFPKKVG